MIVVIQCAASKAAGAGHLVLPSGKPLVFVAKPQDAPPDASNVYVRPDDLAGTGLSWRQELLKYNLGARGNRLDLYPAYRLYENGIYQRLVDRLGSEKVYILSAGWGLLKAEFLTPYYDITFAQSADPYKRRRKTDDYQDFCMLDDTGEDIVFFGGKDYLPLFCSLTGAIRGPKMVYYNSARVPDAPGCQPRRFETAARTNWHYACANAFLDGVLSAH